MKHWIKNLLVLFPLVFSGHLIDPAMTAQGIAAFFAFSFCASAIYIINDIRDVEKDRLHPTKCKRPLASNEAKSSVALALALILAATALGATAFFASKPIFAVGALGTYLLVNVAYSFGLKNIPIVDIAILAADYLLRILYGGFVSAIPISSWLFLTVLAFSFCLALGKRKGELEKSGAQARASLERYSAAFLDKCLYLFMGTGLVFYSLWTFSKLGGLDVFLSYSSILPVLAIPVVMLICMRYSMDIETTNFQEGDPIEVLSKDKALIALALIWGGLLVLNGCL